MGWASSVWSANDVDWCQIGFWRQETERWRMAWWWNHGKKQRKGINIRFAWNCPRNLFCLFFCMWLEQHALLVIDTYFFVGSVFQCTPWTSQISFNWHLCKVLVSQGLFTKYFRNWLIDHASMPCASLDGSRAKGSKCSLLITWKILLKLITKSKHASMITLFWGASAIDFTLQWEKPVILAWKVSEKNMVLWSLPSAWKFKDFLMQLAASPLIVV